MARLPKNPTEATGLLGVPGGATVLAFAPSNGFTEALAEAVGEEGSVLVSDPPPELDAPPNASTEIPDDASGDVVLVWLGPVPAHTIREFPARVAENGSLWAILPRKGRDTPAPVHEAEVKRAMLAAGWRDDRVVGLSTDAYAIRFRRRR